MLLCFFVESEGAVNMRRGRRAVSRGDFDQIVLGTVPVGFGPGMLRCFHATTYDVSCRLFCSYCSSVYISIVQTADLGVSIGAHDDPLGHSMSYGTLTWARFGGFLACSGTHTRVRQILCDMGDPICRYLVPWCIISIILDYTRVPKLP